MFNSFKFVQLCMEIPSHISICGTLYVIISYFTFQKLREIKYLELIFFVALNDFFGSVGMGLGLVHNGTFKCQLQGFFTTYNYLASVFFCVGILYQLYLLVLDRSLPKALNIVIFCQLTPLLLAIIPLSINRYGYNQDYEIDGSGWCLFEARIKHCQKHGACQETTTFIFYCYYFFIVWACIISGIYLYWRIFQKLSQVDLINQSPEVKHLINDLLWYPLTTFMCWIFITISSLFLPYTYPQIFKTQENFRILFGVSVFFVSIIGIINFVVFFTKSKVANREWQILFLNILISLFSSFAPLSLDSSRFSNVRDTLVTERERYDSSVGSVISTRSPVHQFFDDSEDSVSMSTNSSLDLRLSNFSPSSSL